MCVGSIISSCAVSLCSAITCKACGALGSTISVATRITYGIMLAVATGLALAMLADWVQEAVDKALGSYWFLPDYEIGDRLVGALAVYRIMAGVSIFHAVMALLLIGVQNTSDARARLQNDAWCLKLLLYFGLIVAMFFVPTSVFESAPLVYKVGGCLFIFFQLLLLVMFSYVCYEKLLDLGEAQEQDGRARCMWWNFLNIAITLGSYAFCIFVFVVIVVKHTSGDGCGEGVLAACVNMLLMFLTSALSVSSAVRDVDNGPGQINGVFQSGIVAAYANYQLLSAMINHPDARCHLMNIEGGSTWSKVLGLCLVFLSVLYATIRSGSSDFFKQGEARGC